MEIHGPLRMSDYLKPISMIGNDNLAKICGLLPDELAELFNAHNVDVVIGLGRLPRTGPDRKN